MAPRLAGRPKKAYANKGIEQWFPKLDTGLLLFGVASLLSLGYLLLVILRGDLAHPLIGGTQLDVTRNGLLLGRKALSFSLWLLLLLALVRYYRVEAVGYVVMAGGLACWFGMPLLIAHFVPDTAADTLQQTAIELEVAFHGTGVAIFVVGLLRAVLGRIVLMTYRPPSSTVHLPGAAETMAPGGRHSLMRKCWELHFCRGSVRTTCPRYMEAVPCWRRRSGCYCDHDLATRLMGSVGGNASLKMQVAEELESQQRRALQVQRQAQQRRSGKAARKLCRECPIYLEHQKHKYRTLSWVAYPIALLFVALTAAPIRAGYAWADEYAADFVSRYSFIPHNLIDHPIQIVPWINAENFAIGIVGVIFLALLLQTIEAAVFRFKW